MKNLLSILLTALFVTAGAQARVTVYNVGQFDRLSQSGNINIIYRSVPDSTGLAVYDSDIDFSDAIEITNTKGKLAIKEVPGHELGEVPPLRVYSDYLSQIKSEGNAVVEAYISTGTPTLSLSLVGNGRIICDGINSTDVNAAIITGNGTIVARGKCNAANFKLTGTGLIQADGLESQSVHCTTIGTGSIGCWPIKNLDVRGVGTTKVYYRGEPKIKKVGGAKIMPMTTLDNQEDSDESEEVTDDDTPTEVSIQPDDTLSETDDEAIEEEEAESEEEEAEEGEAEEEEEEAEEYVTSEEE